MCLSGESHSHGASLSQALPCSQASRASPGPSQPGAGGSSMPLEHTPIPPLHQILYCAIQCDPAGQDPDSLSPCQAPHGPKIGATGCGGGGGRAQGARGGGGGSWVLRQALAAGGWAVHMGQQGAGRWVLRAVTLRGRDLAGVWANSCAPVPRGRDQGEPSSPPGPRAPINPTCHHLLGPQPKAHA